MSINEIARKPKDGITRVMTDLETTGIAAGCRILSIGAVKFDAEGVIPYSDFYVEINARSSFLAGLIDDPETLQWWDKQSAETNEILNRVDTQGTSLARALYEYDEWLGSSVPGAPKPEMWARGPDFDYGILGHAYRACGWGQQPWEFRNYRCIRTAAAMYPNVRVVSTHEKHNALADAMHQALHASAILKAHAK